MLKKKIKKIIATFVLGAMVLSVAGQGVTVSASTLNNVDSVTKASSSASEVLEDGTYTITNDAFKVGTTDNSGIRDYVDTTSIVTVQDGIITVTLKYADLQLETNTVRTVNSITINGEKVEFKTTDEGISFEVESKDILHSRININLTYYNEFIPEFIAPGGMHTVDVEILHNGELVKVEDNDNVEPDAPEVLADGTYMITNDAFKVGTTDNSGIRDYIDTKSIVTVEDGKITLTLKYTDLELETDTVRTINSITINGEEVEFKANEEEISFEIESTEVLTSRITVNLTYYNEFIPEFIAPGGMHTVDMEILHKGELVKVEDDIVETPETPETPDNDNSGSGDIDGSTGATQKPSEGTGSGSTGATQTDKIYTGKNEIVSDSEAGKAMAREALSEDMKIEKIGEKYRATISFTEFGAAQMSDVIVYVNGKEVETEEVRTTLAGLSFELDSLDDLIEISTKINAMGGRRISFGIKILQDTLVEVENGDEGTIGGTDGGTTQGGTTGGITGGTAQSGQTSGTTEETKKEEAQIVVGKLYSIQNNVTHENETGVAMARMYLNSTSRVEEIEGQYYVTLTFTGAEFMQNHEIYVNGSKVSISKSTSGDETYVRFAVGSLTDSIKVKTYVVPMGRNVEFGVELLIDTLTFIKEYTVETLPNTGAVASSAVVVGLGLLMTSAGVVLSKKRK